MTHRLTPPDLTTLVERAAHGDPRAIGRLITLIENDADVMRPIAALLAPHTGRSHVVGVTGPPGVGKSTTISALVTVLRERKARVGVLTVDPSSPFSGGALLGDRIRIQDHALDDEVFLRSMATRGHLGGLAVAVPQALRVFDTAECDVVFLETVGVGQSEVDVAWLADTTLVLAAPGFGDGIQAVKAGILEIADIFVVNKADRPGAETVVKDLRHLQTLGGRHSEAGAWRPPIVETIAEGGAGGRGVNELVEQIERHRERLKATGELRKRRSVRASVEVEALAIEMLRRGLTVQAGRESIAKLAEQVADGQIDAYAAADRLVFRSEDA
jgi:LAO/AO transport system ATPase